MGSIVILVKLGRFQIAINGRLRVQKSWQPIILIGWVHIPLVRIELGCGLVLVIAMVPWGVNGGVVELDEDRENEGGLEGEIGEEKCGICPIHTSRVVEMTWLGTHL